jgi:hypothetical protein
MLSRIEFLNTSIYFYGDPSTVLRSKDLKFKAQCRSSGDGTLSMEGSVVVT